MEKLTGLCVLLAALSLAVTEDTYFTDGGTLTLNVKPRYPDTITNILWKFNGNLLAEWIKDKVPVEFYRSFKARSTLDTENGQLVVNNTSTADKGEYSVEVNSNVQSVSYTAKWIKSVPQPEVRIRSTHGFNTKVFTVSCDGDTTEAEPVTYTWNMGDREVLGKDIVITVNRNKRDKFFSCRMTNPLSEKVSETINNPVYWGDDKEPSVVWIVIGVLAVLLALGGCMWCWVWFWCFRT